MSLNKRDIYFEIEDGKRERELDEPNEHLARQTQLLEAVEAEDFAKFQQLLSQGVDPDFGHGKQDSLVHYIVRLTGNKETVSMLELAVYFGAPTDLYDRFGQTPLHVAACGTSADAARILLEAGSSVNRQDNTGRTPLMVVCSSQSTNVLVIMQLLLDWRCNVHCVDEDRATALHYTCQNKHQNASTRNEMILKLLYAGVYTTVCDNFGARAISYQQDRLGNVNDDVDGDRSREFEPLESLVRGGSQYMYAPFDSIYMNMFGPSSASYPTCFYLYLDCHSWRSLQRANVVLSRQETNSDIAALRTRVGDYLRRPRSLKSACRFVARECMQGQVFRRCDQLPIPTVLKRYLMFQT